MAGMRVLVCSCVAGVRDIYVYACEHVCGFFFSERIPACHMSHWEFQQAARARRAPESTGCGGVHSRSRPLSSGRDNSNTTNVSELPQLRVKVTVAF